MSCDQCAALQEHVKIRSPGEFRRALHIIRNYLADRSIIDFTAQAVTPSEAFRHSQIRDLGQTSWSTTFAVLRAITTSGSPSTPIMESAGRWEPYVARRV